MNFPTLLPAEFVHRDNRFRATVRLDGRNAGVHVANSGRLTDLFQPGSKVWVSEAENPNRKTKYDLLLVEDRGELVSVDARLPNSLFEEYIRSGTSDDFGKIRRVKREVVLGESRLDFCLDTSDGNSWVETKSVTLVEGGVARFPDAPTSRGRRHLLTLAEAAQNGDFAAVVFIVQRPDASKFTPNDQVDPEFAQTLREVSKKGVKVLAYKCQVSFVKIFINKKILCEL